MDTSSFIRTNLITIATRVFDEDGQFLVGELLREGKLEKAQEYLLFGIDDGWSRGNLTFEDAREFYDGLNLSPEQASQFRQKNLGVLYT